MHLDYFLTMNSNSLPEDCAKQWEILLLLISSEEKKIDRTTESEVDTMNYFYMNEGIRKIMLQWLHQMKSTYAEKSSELDTAKKCDKVSLLWRQKGNDRFRANQVKDSYKCYTKSVVYADHTGPMYTLALANRSASLLRMKKFKECLSDVALALESGYPMEQRHKLLLRRADCYIELLQHAEARLTIAAATGHANSLNLSETHMQEFEKYVKVLEQKLEVLHVEVITTESIVMPECHKGVNPQFNAASNAIELCRNDIAGRFVVSKEATKRGDILVAEEPYAWVSLPSDDPVCAMCCQADINPLPCLQCTRSVYCGSQCRNAASTAFHRWECLGAQCDLFPTIGIAHLALRVLILSAHEGFPELPTPTTSLQSLSRHITAADVFQSYSSVDKIKIYKADSPAFLRMFNLVTNFDKMHNTDYIQYALTATMLTLYLEHFTAFFEYLSTRLPVPLRAHQLRLFAAALVLRSLGQLVCNGHATISLTTCEEDDVANGRTLTEREVRRATAIYPSAAMMNHSCEPNIINTFYRRRLIVRSARDLAAGEQVLNCYGPHCAREPAARRRAQLRAQYMFNCDCGACTDKDRRDSALVFSAYACQVCKGPVVYRGEHSRCAHCLAAFSLAHACAALNHADEMAQHAEEMGTVQERCECLFVAYKLKQQAWHRHHTSLRAAADKLARLYADIGEFGKSLELIKQNIQSLEYQFGSFSVEVAHEMRKLSDVMLERIINSPLNSGYREWCLEAHKIVKKAVQLMELNYGWWEPLVARLRAREAQLDVAVAASRTPGAGADCVHQRLHYNLKI